MLDLEVILAPTRDRVRWGVHAERAGIVVASFECDRVLPTASIGKMLLLIAVAEDLASGALDPAVPLAPADDDRVADSGLWQHLGAPSLLPADAAVLVASVSDNLATNVLLRAVGLPRVGQVARGLGLADTAQLDRLRDVRGPQDPHAPSQGTARELVALMAGLDSADPGSPRARVAAWLELGTDLSMAASALDLDPLAHAGGAFRGKTGTDETVRADIGSALRPDGVRVRYAALASWGEPDEATTSDVMAAMRALGRALLE